MVVIHHPRKGFWQCGAGWPCGAGWRSGIRHATLYPDRAEALNVAAMREIRDFKTIEPSAEQVESIKDQARRDVAGDIFRRQEDANGSL